MMKRRLMSQEKDKENTQQFLSWANRLSIKEINVIYFLLIADKSSENKGN